MILDKQEYNFDRVFRLAITVGIILAGIWLLGYLSDVLIPFVAAFLLAYLLNPIVCLVQKKVPNRLGAVLLTLVGVVILVVILCVIFVPMIMAEIGHMGQVAKDVATDPAVAERAQKALPPGLWAEIKKYVESQEIQEFLKQERALEMVQTVARKVLPGVWNVVAGTASFLWGLMGLVVVALYLVFMLLDYQKLIEEWENLIPPTYREGILGFIEEFDSAMNRYFRSQAVVASIVGVLFAIGFSIIGLPMGILLGLLIGLLNMVPYLQIIGIAPALLLGVMGALEGDGNVFAAMGMVLAVFAVVQAIQDGFLTPKIMGKVTGLSPAMILLSLSVWGKLLGLLGVIIALPVTCLLLAYYRRTVLKAEAAAKPAAADAAGP
ncbi:AI-2E family transporter [Candidatus Sumerlaeota bacterium]